MNDTTSTPVPSPEPTPSGGPHDWGSREYVRFWAQRTDREEPERRHRFELLADLIPFAEDAPIEVLDLGSGYGALGAVILERFPAARLTCLDGSAAMLDLLGQRQARFAGRMTRVEASYDDDTWTAKLGDATFDAIVSSQALHGQRERRRTLYRDLYDLLRPGGCFLNVDLVPATTPELRDRVRDVQVRRRIRAEEATTGRRPSAEEVIAALDGLRPDGTQPARDERWGLGEWTDDLRWLREAGFSEVDCYWKELRLALIGGRRPQGGPAQRIGGIHSVALFVSDLDRSVDFYTRLIAAAPIDRHERVAVFALGDGRLILHADGGRFGPEARRGVGVALHLEVADVDAEAARLASAGIALSEEPATQPWGIRELAVRDPDGYEVELVGPVPGPREGRVDP